MRYENPANFVMTNKTCTPYDDRNHCLYFLLRGALLSKAVGILTASILILAIFTVDVAITTLAVMVADTLHYAARLQFASKLSLATIFQRELIHDAQIHIQCIQIRSIHDFVLSSMRCRSS